MTRLSMTAFAFAGVAFLAIALGPARAAEDTAASAGQKEWNQEEVTAIAKQLAGSVKDLRAAFRREGSPTREHMQGRAHHQMRDDLRLIRNETAHLARELEAGKGSDETLPIVRRLGMLRPSRELFAFGCFGTGFVLASLVEPVLRGWIG